MSCNTSKCIKLPGGLTKQVVHDLLRFVCEANVGTGQAALQTKVSELPPTFEQTMFIVE